MQKETIRALVSVVLRGAVERHGKSSVDRTYLSEVLDHELPGLDNAVSEEILEMCMKLLPFVEVHVEVGFWHMDEQEHQAMHDAQPQELGSVW